MSEQSEAYRAIADNNKAIRHQRQKDKTQILLNYCEENDIEIRDIQPWQLRLSYDGKVVDIYPQKNRFHIITCNARGEYSELISFLNIIFNM